MQTSVRPTPPCCLPACPHAIHALPLPSPSLSIPARLADNKQDVELPPPALVKPQELWTGKQLFSLLLRPK